MFETLLCVLTCDWLLIIKIVLLVGCSGLSLMFVFFFPSEGFQVENIFPVPIKLFWKLATTFLLASLELKFVYETHHWPYKDFLVLIKFLLLDLNYKDFLVGITTLSLLSYFNSWNFWAMWFFVTSWEVLMHCTWVYYRGICYFPGK